MLPHDMVYDLLESFSFHKDATILNLTDENISIVSKLPVSERATVVFLNEDSKNDVVFNQSSTFSLGVGGLLSVNDESHQIRTNIAMIQWLHERLSNNLYNDDQIQLLLCEKYLKQSVALSDTQLSETVSIRLTRLPTVKRKRLIKQRLDTYINNLEEKHSRFNVRNLLTELTAHIFVNHNHLDSFSIPRLNRNKNS
jgi:hypothetical protein